MRFLICLIFLIGCKDNCENTKEPAIPAVFYKKDGYLTTMVDTTFSKVFVKGYDKTIIKNDPNVEVISLSPYYYPLPLDLGKETLTYIFTAASGSDTLTLRYQRKFVYQKKCGYEAKITGIEAIQPTSFDSVVTNNYGIKIFF